VNNENGICLWVPADGSQAVIQSLLPGTSKSDIQASLSRMKVIAGIDWAKIDEALAKAGKTGAAVAQVIVATAEPPVAATWLCGTMLDNGVTDIMPGLVAFGGNELAEAGGAKKKGTGAFVKRNEAFLKFEIISYGKNVFGGHMKVRPASAPQYDAATINLRENENGQEYIALLDGYLYAFRDAIHGLLRIAIRDALSLSSDRMVLSALIANVRTGRKDLVDFIIGKWFELRKGKTGEAPPERKMLEGLLDSGTAQSMVLSRGRMAIPGIPGRIDMRIAFGTPAGAIDSGEKIDHHMRSPFHEIRKSAVIAECIPAKKGTSGEDALGNVIPVEDVKDAAFYAGLNVVTVSTGQCVRYESAIDGIAVMRDGMVDVLPDLRIAGDVGPETGNIGFSGPILIGGSVLSGYAVVCGGDMTVMGCIENGAIIECGGSLTVNGGLIGEKTVCSVKKEVKAGYVQDCNLRAAGNIVVKSYIYNSFVFSGQELRVEGEHVTSHDRGAVVGGQVGAMKSLTLHSAGSFVAKTELVSGIDLETEKLLIRVNQTEPVLARHIAVLQIQIGIDVHNPQATIQAFTQLPFLRDKMKDKVVELKKVVKERDQLIRARPELEKRAYAEDLSKVFVEIQHHCAPELLIRMGRATKMLRQKLECKKFMNIEGLVISTDL
jgi:uncharacterized protein (DUF342 family)